MKKPCIQVEHALGEQLRVLLVEQELFDPDFPITKDETFLYIPLRRDLKSNELSEFEQKIGKLTIIEKELEPVSRKPTDLSTALAGILPDVLHQWLPHSMDIIGEIAIVELNKQLEMYEEKIGEAIMKVNSRVVTVYKKEGGVEGVCRLRPLRLIAGKNQPKTIHTEYGVQIAIDVTQAYFSPRLGTEHDRVAGMVESGEVVVDLFTGVGPFALLMAKRQKVEVFAIDINPEAIQCLQKSLEMNRLVGTVFPIVGDARTIVNQKLAGKADRIIMNLPNDAISFLDTAAKALKVSGGFIHFYGIVSESMPLERLAAEVINQLAKQGFSVLVLNSRVVRPAAPHEDQVVLDLLLTPGETSKAT